jgi:hypothetical protein
MTALSLNHFDTSKAERQYGVLEEFELQHPNLAETLQSDSANACPKMIALIEPELGAFIVVACCRAVPVPSFICIKLNRFTDDAETMISTCEFEMMP